MANFDFVVTLDEYAFLLQGAFDQGYRLCINKRYTSPQSEYVASKREIRLLLNVRQFHFSLQRADFSRYPIRMFPFIRQGIQMWTPDPQYSGPLIDLSFGAPFERDGIRGVPVATISHYANIFNPVTRQSEPVGNAVRNAYKEIVDPMRKNFRKVKFTKRTAYVSPGVNEMLQAGWVLGWSVAPAARIGSQADKIEPSTS